jgi:hypothetical protein
MSITRLQQARQMYAMGQRVAKTMDGSRPGYKGRTDAESQYGGDYSNTGQSIGSGSGGGGNARENYISKQYTNLPTPTVTVGVDKFDNPITVKTTYKDKRARQKTLDALNEKGISSFDPRVTKKGINLLDPNNLINSFAPKQQKKFGILDLVMIAASGGLLGPKVGSIAKGINTAKFALDKSKQIGGLLETIGLTDKNVVDSFTSNLSDKFSGFGTGKKSTTSTSIDEDLSKIGNGDGGLESLGNMDALNQEYLLLLNKFNSGNFTDTDQVRFTFLKNMLGK